jgi:signal transduction histidine kinase
MLLSMQARRAILPLAAVGVVLLVASIVTGVRDIQFARREAESEILALAEAAAAAIQIIGVPQRDSYVGSLLTHPAVATVTVYPAGGERTTRSRPSSGASPWVARLVPSLREPVVGCRAIDGLTVCLEGDLSHYQARVAALAIPHGLLLAGVALLLGIASLFARGSSRRELRELARVLRIASEENNYALRAREGTGETGDLARAVNKLLEQMQQRDLILRRRTTELEAANAELEAFSYSVSHDLRSPLSSMNGFSQALRDEYADRLDETALEYLGWIENAVEQMNNLIHGLLQMSRVSRAEVNRTRVDVTAMATGIAEGLQLKDPARHVDFRIEPSLHAHADERLLHAVLENLMSNAWKFTGKAQDPTIAVGSRNEHGRLAFFVRDNGAGFDSTSAARLFTPFQRLHSSSEFEGTGIGLSTVKRIIERHGGAIWAEGSPGNGATFFFTLGEGPGAERATPAAELIGVTGD